MREKTINAGTVHAKMGVITSSVDPEALVRLDNSCAPTHFPQGKLEPIPKTLDHQDCNHHP